MMYLIIIAIMEITIGVFCVFSTWASDAGALRTPAAGVITMAEPTKEPNGRTAVAAYVATLSNDLATMARRTGLETLGYLLEMVRFEAESVTRHNGTQGPGSQ